MESINVFKRYELKYIINEAQKNEVMKEVGKRMTPDPHGESTIRNIYFDSGGFADRSVFSCCYLDKSA